MDLVIREADGWEELEDAWSTLVNTRVNVSEFWRAVGAGDHDLAVKLLEDAGWEFNFPPVSVRIITVPDDIMDERHRVWVKKRS